MTKTQYVWTLVLSSVLWTFCFPVAYYSHNLTPGWLSSVLCWFALVPAIMLIPFLSPKRAFQYGYVYGILSNSGVFFWVIVAMQKYGNLSIILSTLIMVGMVVFLGLFSALAFWGTKKLEGRAPFWVTGALVFSIVHWSLNYIPAGGFPWANPAYSLHSFLQFIQVADILGMNSLTFILCLSNFVIADWTSNLMGKKANPFPKKGFATLISLFFTFLIYGHFAYQKWDRHNSNPKAPVVRIALLQGNIAQNLKWNASEQVSILTTYRNLMAEATEFAPDLIVWPEAAWPMTLMRNTRNIPFVRGAGNAQVVIGAPTWQISDQKQEFFNSAFVVDPSGHVIHRYDKQHLVPFGEYVPLSNYLPMRYIVPSIAGNFVEGDRKIELSAVTKEAAHRYGILICYEVLFPELSVANVRKGAEFFVNITNDAWFDITSGPFQHLNFGVYRAIETRRPIVRAANTGISAWYDNLGKIHAATSLEERKIVQASIHPESTLTFYVRYPWIMTTFYFGLFFYLLRKGKWNR